MSDAAMLRRVIPFVRPAGLPDDADQAQQHYQPRSSCLIATLPRSGSWLLAELLASIRLVGVPNEYFRPDFTAAWSTEWGLPEGSSFRAYVEEAKLQTTTPNGMFAAKLHWYQFEWLCEQLRAEGRSGTSTAELIADCFPAPAYVFLQRHDTARQAISYYRASATQQWFANDRGQAKLSAQDADLQQIKWFEQTLVERNRDWRSFFETENVRALDVFYEDFVADYDATVAAILAYLGVSLAEKPALPTPTLRRQSDEVSKEILERYLAARDTLADKPSDLRWDQVARRYVVIGSPDRRSPNHLAHAEGQKGAKVTLTRVSFEWKRWAAYSLMGGMSVDAVADRMARAGIDRAVALHVCGELMESPAYAAGDWMSQRLRKLESTLSREDFFSTYYSTNTPVVLEDIADKWPALEHWSPEYFADVMGDSVVEVMAGRDANPNYERESQSHRRKLSINDYVRTVVGTSATNDIYLVANNHLLEIDAAKPLWQDFEIDERYLRPDRSFGHAFLWFGPSGTFTPLHHDVLNVLFTQVFGTKRVRLISPLDSHCVANNFGVYSDVDARSPDLTRFPRFATTQQVTVEVGPGEALFIPVGWWHCVQALETSASVSFTNFVYSNNYKWAKPKIKF
jgi:LPS sulfotransferase NodH